MRFQNIIKIMLVLLAFSSARVAKADSLFTYVTGSSTYSFQLPDAPTPDSSSAGSNFTVSTNVTSNGGAVSKDTLTFYTSLLFGGFADSAKGLSLHGSQLFTGSVSAPTFVRGTFNMYSDVTMLNRVGTLTIAQAQAQASASPTAIAATPEPSSLVLLGTGLVGLSVALRRRSRMASLTSTAASAA